MTELQVSRITATRYLNELTRIGLMTKHRLGRDNYYVNDALYSAIQEAIQTVTCATQSCGSSCGNLAGGGAGGGGTPTPAPPPPN